MQQSNAIFAAIVVAFIIFITARGKLPAYLGLLLGEAGGTTGANSGSGLSLSLGGNGSGGRIYVGPSNSNPAYGGGSASSGDAFGGSSSNPLQGLTAGF